MAFGTVPFVFHSHFVVFVHNFNVCTNNTFSFKTMWLYYHLED